MAEDGTPSEAAEEPTAAAPAPKPSKPVPKTKTRAILRSSRRLRFAVVALVIIGLFAGGIYYERTRNKPQKKDPYAGLAWGTTSTYDRLSNQRLSDEGGVGADANAGGLDPDPALTAKDRVDSSTSLVPGPGPGPDPCSLLSDEEVGRFVGTAVRSKPSTVPGKVVPGSSVLRPAVRRCTWTTEGTEVAVVLDASPDDAADVFFEQQLGFLRDPTRISGLGGEGYLGTRSATRGPDSVSPPDDPQVAVALARTGSSAFLLMTAGPADGLDTLIRQMSSRLSGTEGVGST